MPTKKYKFELLATNAHRRGHNAHNPILGNKGYKDKYVIAPLLHRASTNNARNGLTVPRAMVVNDNRIDYVHWYDPNELVDRLRLLEASHQAGNNSHDSEILSIYKELH